MEKNGERTVKQNPFIIFNQYSLYCNIGLFIETFILGWYGWLAIIQNRYDLENGVDTPATQMMKKRGITGRRHSWKSVENNMKLSIKEIDN